jgi:hypothetical protein
MAADTVMDHASNDIIDIHGLCANNRENC